jgi:hypothetical protein
MEDREPRISGSASDAIDAGSRWLGQILHAVGRKVDDLAEALKRGQQRLEDIDKRLQRVTNEPRVGGEPDATELERLLGQLLQTQRDHEARLAALSRQRTAERLTSGDYIVHHEIARRYSALIDQDLVDTVVASGKILEQRQEAEWRRWLARVLFTPAYYEPGLRHARGVLRKHGVAVPEENFDRVWNSAAEIRASAEQSRHPHRWVFDEPPIGQPVDRDKQRVYEGCAPDDPVQFVVAPSYVVGDRIYALQLVFTAPAPPQQSELPDDATP